MKQNFIFNQRSIYPYIKISGKDIFHNSLEISNSIKPAVGSSTTYLSRWRNGIPETVVRTHGTQGLAAPSVTQSSRDAGRRWGRRVARSLQRRAVRLVHTCSRKRDGYIYQCGNRERNGASLLARFIYLMYRVRLTSRCSVISYDVGYLMCSTYAVECVKCGRLKSVRWSYDCAST